MIWLGIDTSNVPLSIAVVKDNQLLVEWTSSIKVTHSVGAMPAVEEALKQANINPGEIDVIAVAEGPGSYTGVRIGVTIAKTLAWTLKIPLVGVSSLQTIAGNGLLFNGLICPIMDARRDNVFSAIYTNDLTADLPDGHYAIETILEKLALKQENVLFVGKDVSIHWQAIQRVLGDRAIRAPFYLDLPKASVVIEQAMKKPLPSIEETHHFVPEYKRITEAETNWLAEQQKVGESND
ncbi:tRNA (adenosine(37)-N6)-threonylcarbamoyltransferase complex dimerization subunit type 1 TsaB [Paenisporosarcina sp. OV554]|uniref:tRNA (adenosine(37)-N6)-threonylcarbamoyltransferase complex dimerization subunit type 1 TsaB n=1 Tax=Paenisporosarcina sp. OV554 TaxID=2135694 RepID=UPI000D38CF5C|nr:tRNA (adenosine(37)-N6)-threonylcarbamoyltransferase complex dimerization subunit type 1 TsaB [Paenisporosarcina sp. OV554]PUB09502.1 tRNA threonylcarbamoyladenosine biosynthesis protein TsaB [Paenisporosarcina sp. OV554]